MICNEEQTVSISFDHFLPLITPRLLLWTSSLRVRVTRPRLVKCWDVLLGSWTNNPNSFLYSNHKQGQVQGVQEKCVFSKNFNYFATAPSRELGCFWLYRNSTNWPANGSDCILALRREHPVYQGQITKSMNASSAWLSDLVYGQNSTRFEILVQLLQ